MPIEWSYIEEYIVRARVHGGWLVAAVDSDNVPVNLVFIPDQGHEWQCEDYYESGDDEEEEDY